MLKIHDSASNSFVEKLPKIYDAIAGAWKEAPSVKTYDATQSSWIERLLLDNYFTKLVFSFDNGGSYHVSEDKRAIDFDFKSDSYTTDNASLQWEGKEVVNGFFMGQFDTNNADLNPDVYFYYNGTQVYASKLRTQANNLFAIRYEGPVDKIVINIVPGKACYFSLMDLYFDQKLRFEIERS